MRKWRICKAVARFRAKTSKKPALDRSKLHEKEPSSSPFGEAESSWLNDILVENCKFSSLEL